MPAAFYSVVLDHPAADTWKVICLFDHYAWAGFPPRRSRMAEPETRSAPCVVSRWVTASSVARSSSVTRTRTARHLRHLRSALFARRKIRIDDPCYPGNRKRESFWRMVRNVRLYCRLASHAKWLGALREFMAQGEVTSGPVSTPSPHHPITPDRIMRPPGPRHAVCECC